MKKILFVEDQPDYKLHVFICWIKLKNIKVEYLILGSINEAKKYLSTTNEKIDLVVTDLGLPRFRGERVENSLQGVELVRFLPKFNSKIPVIIYSTTDIPNFNLIKKEYDSRGQELYKVKSILDMRDWLEVFLID